MKKLTTEDYIALARTIHGDRYEYAKLNYVTSKKKVTITCPEHGDFEQTPNNHRAGCGCPVCGRLATVQAKTDGFQAFLVKARAMHGGKYSYDEGSYILSSRTVSIFCPEHGVFHQLAASHVSGSGCQLCANQAINMGLRLSKAKFIEKAVGIHGAKYDYSATIYNGRTRSVDIVCPQHGQFTQKANDHLSGCGCPACWDERRGSDSRLTQGEFVAKAVAMHGDIYDYGKSSYSGSDRNVTITCSKHGDFTQVASNHIYVGQGCPKCGLTGPSKPELELLAYVQTICPDAIGGDRSLLSGLEIDVLIPSIKVGIEFNGLIWHSERYGKGREYHQQKTNAAAAAGYRLIHIWEDEWENKRAWCEAFLDRVCGKHGRRLFARKCEIRQIHRDLALPFLATNHLQGARNGAHVGVFSGEELVAVATHATNSIGEHELIRWCVKLGVSVVGGFSRVLSHLPKGIVSFCDTAKHTGDGYLAAGWVLKSETAPMYYYTDGRVRIGRQRFQKKKLIKLGAGCGGTEREMAKELGFYQIGGLKQLKFVFNGD